MHEPSLHSQPISVLFVCTGNQHRSPMAQALLIQELDARGLHVQVASIGLLPGGQPLPQETKDALVALGLSVHPLESFLSTELTTAAPAAADLVLGLAREHVREVVVAMPEAWDRTFTLKELIRRGETVGPRPSGESLRDWLGQVSEGRLRSDLLGSSTEDDVVDPIGGPPSEFNRTAHEIQRLCRSLIDLVWPSRA